MAEFHLAASREFLLTIVFMVTVLLNNQILHNLHNIRIVAWLLFQPIFSPGYSINTVSLDHIDVYLVWVKRSPMCFDSCKTGPPPLPQTRDNVLAKVDRNPFLSTSSCYIIQLISN